MIKLMAQTFLYGIGSLLVGMVASKYAAYFLNWFWDMHEPPMCGGGAGFLFVVTGCAAGGFILSRDWDRRF